MRTANCTMSEAARNAQREYKREYMRKWRAENKDKVSANNRNYWERRAQRGKEQQNAETVEAENPDHSC